MLDAAACCTDDGESRPDAATEAAPAPAPAPAPAVATCSGVGLVEGELAADRGDVGAECCSVPRAVAGGGESRPVGAHQHRSQPRVT